MNDEGEMERNNVNDLLYVFMDARNDKGERQREFVKESAIHLYEWWGMDEYIDGKRLWKWLLGYTRKDVGQGGDMDSE